MGLIYDRKRGEVIDDESGVVIEERVPDPELDEVNLLFNASHPKEWRWGWGLGTVKPTARMEKGVRKIINLYNRALSTLGIIDDWRTKVIESAVYYFRLLEEKGLFKKGFRRDVAAAAFLLAMNDFRFPIMPNEKVVIVEDVFITDERKVSKVIKQATLTLGKNYVTPSPEAYLLRLCGEEGIPRSKCMDAMKQLRKFKGTPPCKAARALATICDEGRKYVKELCRRRKRKNTD